MKKLIVPTVLIIVLLLIFFSYPKNATDYLVHKYKNDSNFSVDEIIKIEEYDNVSLFIYKTKNAKIGFIAVTEGKFKNFYLSSSAYFRSSPNEDEPDAHYCRAKKKSGYEGKNNINYFVCVYMNANDSEAYFNEKKLKTIQIEDSLYAYDVYLNETEPNEFNFTYK